VRPLALDGPATRGVMASASASVGERGGDELLADLVLAAAGGHATAGTPVTLPT
jgi:hypothetical protein